MIGLILRDMHAYSHIYILIWHRIRLPITSTKEQTRLCNAWFKNNKKVMQYYRCLSCRKKSRFCKSKKNWRFFISKYSFQCLKLHFVCLNEAIFGSSAYMPMRPSSFAKIMTLAHLNLIFHEVALHADTLSPI